MISRKRHNKSNQGVIDTNILYEPIEIRDIFYIGFGGIGDRIDLKRRPSFQIHILYVLNYLQKCH
jgi:hypothetical protein